MCVNPLNHWQGERSVGALQPSKHQRGARALFHYPSELLQAFEGFCYVQSHICLVLLCDLLQDLVDSLEAARLAVPEALMLSLTPSVDALTLRLCCNSVQIGTRWKNVLTKLSVKKRAWFKKCFILRRGRKPKQSALLKFSITIFFYAMPFLSVRTKPLAFSSNMGLLGNSFH